MNTVSAEERSARQGYEDIVVWLTGLSGAGKTTLSRALERRLWDEGHAVLAVDGDELRYGLNVDLGFSRNDRHENVRRAAEVARLISKGGTIPIMGLISPCREDRRRARAIVENGGGCFVEVFVRAPLEVCEKRDVKGLYKKAREGKISDFTGLSSPYEEPELSEVVVHTDRQSVEECVEAMMSVLRKIFPVPGEKIPGTVRK